MAAATAAIIAQSVIIIGLLVVLHSFVGSAREEREARATAAEAERRELLERIQRPDRPPVTSMPAFDEPDAEPDDSHLVGTIVYPDEIDD